LEDTDLRRRHRFEAYIDLLEDTDLRREHGSEAVHRFVRRHRFEERTCI
jgi:hypothetical protein